MRGYKFLLLLSIFYVFFLQSDILCAQNSRLVDIKIVSSAEKEILPGALMSFQKSSFAFSSNNSGEIVLYPEKFLPSDTAVFTYLGHYTRKVPVSEFKIGIVNIVELKQKKNTIEKVIVVPRKAEHLLIATRNNITENFPPFPMLMKAYFRETVYENNIIIRQIQAVADIYKQPYNNPKNDKISFVHGNIAVNDSLNRLWEYLFFIDGTYEALFADIAKNPDNFIQIPVIKTNFFKENQFRYYKYNVFAEKDKYVIKFSPAKHRKKGVFEGEILLGKNNYEILEYSYGYSPARSEKIKYALSLTDIDLQSDGVYSYPKDYTVKVCYSKRGGYTVLKSVEIKYCFNFSVGNSAIESSYCVVEELFVNDYKTDNLKKINLRKQVSKGKDLIKQLPDNIIFTPKERYPKF